MEDFFKHPKPTKVYTLENLTMLFDQMKKKLSDVSCSPFNIVYVIPIICEIVENARFVTAGSDKKELVVSLFAKFVIEELHWKDEDVKGCVDTVNCMIDVSIALTKGKYAINKVVGCFEKLKKLLHLK